jgi:hypothetical protein
MYRNFLQAPLDESQLPASFFCTPLGKLYRAIPFKALAKKISKPKREQSGKGRKPWFDVGGGIALQVLKAYFRCSDAKLIELLNGDGQLQLFCGVQLRPGEQIRDVDLVGRWRRYLSRYLDIDRLQVCLVQCWKPWLDHPHLGLMDATVFESEIAHPSDASLLWKSCGLIYHYLQKLRRQLCLRKSRIRHGKRLQRYLHFALLKKKSYQKNKAVCRYLLHYLDQLLQALELLQTTHPQALLFSLQNNRLAAIHLLKGQQEQLHLQKASKVEGRIVSLCKPYVRPIVRGKQTKTVEFGCKVQVLCVDGISFLEHVSFEAFNEGTRLQSTVHLQERYLGGCFQLGADRIYATNDNRRYCTEHHTYTSFIPKGKEGPLLEQKAKMRAVLSKTRGTVLEGSFGNQKNHYLLDKIKAKTMATEITWIFFCLLTANAMQIVKRMHKAKQIKSAA